MTYVQATQGGGGWPMSCFLTPSLEPFFGGERQHPCLPMSACPVQPAQPSSIVLLSIAHRGAAVRVQAAWAANGKQGGGREWAGVPPRLPF
jgi:hypothetical protein